MSSACYLICHGSGKIRIADDAFALFIQCQLFPAKDIFTCARAFRLKICGRTNVSPLHIRSLAKLGKRFYLDAAERFSPRAPSQ